MATDDLDTTDELRSLEMNRIHEMFGEQEFPVTTEELLDEFDDVVVDYPGGDSERLRPILETSGRETYDTSKELQLAVLNGVSRNAVGRPRYSDRDPPTVGDDQDFQQSF